MKKTDIQFFQPSIVLPFIVALAWIILLSFPWDSLNCHLINIELSPYCMVSNYVVNPIVALGYVLTIGLVSYLTGIDFSTFRMPLLHVILVVLMFGMLYLYGRLLEVVYARLMGRSHVKKKLK